MRMWHTRDGLMAACCRLLLRACCPTGEFIEPLLPTLAPQADIPLHVQHMSERLGQLVMLHLGEAIIGIAATPLESTVPQFTAVALAATLAWALHLIYYHVEPDEHSHAYRQSRMRGLLYFYCHWLLTVALLLTGSGLRLLLGECFVNYNISVTCVWEAAESHGGMRVNHRVALAVLVLLCNGVLVMGRGRGCCGASM